MLTLSDRDITVGRVLPNDSMRRPEFFEDKRQRSLSSSVRRKDLRVPCFAVARSPQESTQEGPRTAPLSETGADRQDGRNRDRGGHRRPVDLHRGRPLLPDAGGLRTPRGGVHPRQERPERTLKKPSGRMYCRPRLLGCRVRSRVRGGREPVPGQELFLPPRIWGYPRLFLLLLRFCRHDGHDRQRCRRGEVPVPRLPDIHVRFDWIHLPDCEPLGLESVSVVR